MTPATGADAGAARSGVTLIGVPYHHGRPRHSMGSGPVVLLQDERVPAGIRALGIDLELQWLDIDDPADAEDLLLPTGDQIARHLFHNRIVARMVGAAREAGRVPIVLAGDCNTALGVVGGLDDPELGVVWVDAHADAHTPETSASGLFDGMPVATLAGRCWKTWRESIPGFHAVDERRIVSVGMHAHNERASAPLGTVVERSALAAADFEPAVAEALDRLAERARHVYLHIDTDVLDPSEGRASNYTAPGGLSAAELARLIEMVGDRFKVGATSFTCFDPEVDPAIAGTLTRLVTIAADAGITRS